MPLFANSVTVDDPQVFFMRSLITLAGPLETSEKRHRDIKDGRPAQDSMVTDYQVQLRELAADYDSRSKIMKTQVYGRLLQDVIFADTL